MSLYKGTSTDVADAYWTYHVTDSGTSANGEMILRSTDGRRVIGQENYEKCSEKKERLHYDQKFQIEKRNDASDGSLPDLVGHAAVFDSEIEIKSFFGSFTEVIARGAFTKNLATEPDVRALLNHDPNLVLGRTKSGTLQLREDEIGLHSRISPPDTTLGRDLVVSIERGDISQMSFGFQIVKEEVEERDDEPPKITILEARLFDVSPVTYPAYSATDISVARSFRSADQIWEEEIASRRNQSKEEKRLALLEYMKRKARIIRLKIRA